MSSKLPPLPVPSDAIEDIEAVLTLIRTGRAELAIPLLERLPRRLEGDIVENAGWMSFRNEQRHVRDLHAAVEHAYHVGREAGRAEARREAAARTPHQKPRKITTARATCA